MGAHCSAHCSNPISPANHCPQQPNPKRKTAKLQNPSDSEALSSAFGEHVHPTLPPKTKGPRLGLQDGHAAPASGAPRPWPRAGEDGVFGPQAGARLAKAPDKFGLPCLACVACLCFVVLRCVFLLGRHGCLRTLPLSPKRSSTRSAKGVVSTITQGGHCPANMGWMMLLFVLFSSRQVWGC